MHRVKQAACASMAGVALLALLLSLNPVAVAATPGAEARAEIAHLLAYLEGSRCAFYRNGDWHAAAEARSHLERKRDYLEKRSMVGTAEQFIERAATSSSFTGEAYKVRCGAGPAVPSGTWLRAELKRYRVVRAEQRSLGRP